MANISSEIDYTVIGRRIKTLRDKSGKSLAELAEMCGVQQYQTVSKWEKGNSYPSLQQLLRLCDIFQCDIDYLLGNIPCKTREVTDIVKATGLSSDAVEQLLNWQANKTVSNQNRLSLVDALIRYREIYLIANLYRTLQIDKTLYNNRETKYLECKDYCDSEGDSKEDFFASLYEPVRERIFKLLLEFQRFLDK